MKFILTFVLSFLLSVGFSQIVLLEDGFDLGSSLEQWTIIDNDGHDAAPPVEEYTQAWIIKEDPIEEGNGVISSTSYFSPVNRADRWLITPLISLGDESNYFSWRGMSHDPSFPDSYKVMISTTGNEIEDFTDTLLVVSNENPTWTEYLEFLDDYANQEIYIAFVNTTYDGFKLYLDDVYIRSNDPLSLNKEEIQFEVYPNPTVNVLNIQTGNSVMEEVVVLNSIGQTMIDLKVDKSSSVQLNLESLNQGFYFVQVKTPKGIFSKRVVKK